MKNFPELINIPLKTFWQFYKKKVKVSYKRISIREPKIVINYEALTS